MSTYYEEDNLDIFLDSEKTVALNKRGQPRKRKPKEPRIYFTPDTEEAIIEYLASTDQIFIRLNSIILTQIQLRN